QASHSGGASPPGRPAPRQTAAPLCRPHCRVHPDPCRRHTLRPPRLHRAHLGRAGLHGSLAPFLQEVRPRSCHAGPSDNASAQRVPHAGVATTGCRDAAGPTGPAAASPFFVTTTQYAGAFLLMPAALEWLATARDCFADAYGCLRQGLLTSVFALVVGL